MDDIGGQLLLGLSSGCSYDAVSHLGNRQISARASALDVERPQYRQVGAGVLGEYALTSPSENFAGVRVTSSNSPLPPPAIQFHRSAEDSASLRGEVSPPEERADARDAEGDDEPAPGTA